MTLLQYSALVLLLFQFTSSEDDYYKILGLDRSASKEDIQKAFNKLSLKYHPDKVKDADKAEAMKKYEAISNAYEVLSDDEQREIYDMGGVDALRRHEQGDPGGPTGDPFDIFDMFRTDHAEVHSRVVRPTVIPLDLTLEELFTGKQIDTVVSRRVICSSCKGNGAAPNGMKTCPYCHGSGTVMHQQRMPFGIFQTQAACDHCSGTGRIIKQKCSVCKGGGTVMASEKLSFPVPPGSPDGHEITFDKKGDEAPNMQTGRLIFKVREKRDAQQKIPFTSSANHPDAYDHFNIQQHNLKQTKPSFTRDQQNNLHTTITISLADSITGADFIVPHFLNRTVTISRKGKRTPEGTEVEVKGEGMPLPKSRGVNPLNWIKSGANVKRASLFVRFHVEYPRTITEEQLDLIRKALY